MGACPDANDERESSAASLDGVGRGGRSVPLCPLSLGELVRDDELEDGSCEMWTLRAFSSRFSFF